jgi:hypothetical protein
MSDMQTSGEICVVRILMPQVRHEIFGCRLGAQSVVSLDMHDPTADASSYRFVAFGMREGCFQDIARRAPRNRGYLAASHRTVSANFRLMGLRRRAFADIPPE